MNRGIEHAVKALLTTADKYGVKMDPKLRKRIEDQTNRVEVVEGFDFRSDVEGALNDAVEAGRDPASDPAVQAALTSKQLSSFVLSGSLVDVTRGRLYNLLRDNLDPIVAAFQPAHDEAGRKFAEKHAVLTAAGVMSLDDTSAIASMGLPIARANLDAREQLEVVRTIQQRIGALLAAAESIDGTPVGRIVATVDAGDTHANDLRRSLPNGLTLTPWEAITAGYTISLATPTETRERREHAYDLEAGYDAQVADSLAKRSTPGYWGEIPKPTK